MTRTAPRLLAARAVLILIALATACVALLALRTTHTRAAEAAWLGQHARTGSYDVVELGELRPDGTATGVWVSQSRQPQAFVDLGHSSQKIDAVGQAVRARIDNRDAPATAEGVAADAVGRSFLGDYVAAGWPLAVTVLALLALLGLRRLPLGQAPGGSTDRDAARSAASAQ